MTEQKKYLIGELDANQGGELEATYVMFPQGVVAQVLNSQQSSLVWIDEKLHDVFFRLAYVVYCHHVHEVHFNVAAHTDKRLFVPVIRGCLKSRRSVCCQAVLRSQAGILAVGFGE